METNGHEGLIKQEKLKKDQTIKDEQIKQLETLNTDLHQRLQGKTNLKELKTEGNLLKQEKTMVCVCACMYMCVFSLKSILLNVLQLTSKIENLGIMKTILFFIKQL
jgi:hypothetical protein